ncbi:hypothetical protein BRO54_2835 [Geobacillus proteiniphilus]|uniref:Uncharacterized protein n=1 Tax=Geobacillus proteiniphilus TaxID=860353 RepID=A0A1Q5ST17_9BACL|nr:hypothetical protein BRO54_2835 [Geobacillus proteiniphilus]
MLNKTDCLNAKRDPKAKCTKEGIIGSILFAKETRIPHFHRH